MSPMIGLLQAGLDLKIGQIKLASRSYFRDRADQATATATSYFVATGLYAAAAVFFLATCLVGIAALFRCVEIKYGQFWAFGAVGTLMVVLGAICAALAAAKLHRKTSHFPSLTSRLRVAVAANPVTSVAAASVNQTAAAPASAAPVPRVERDQRAVLRSSFNSRNMQAGLAMTAILLGCAVVQRQQRARSRNA